MSRKTVLAAAVLAAAVMGARGDTITGNLMLHSTIIHQGGSASRLTESLGTLWYWDGATGALGTNGQATYLSTIYVANVSIAGGETNTLDLSGTLNNSFGQTVNLSAVKLLFVAPTAPEAGTVTVRPAASAGWTNWCDAVEGVNVRIGGALMLAAPDLVGYPVSNGVSDTLEIVNNTTNTASVKIIVAGE